MSGKTGAKKPGSAASATRSSSRSTAGKRSAVAASGGSSDDEAIMPTMPAKKVKTTVAKAQKVTDLRQEIAALKSAHTTDIKELKTEQKAAIDSLKQQIDSLKMQQQAALKESKNELELLKNKSRNDLKSSKLEFDAKKKECADWKSKATEALAERNDAKSQLKAVENSVQTLQDRVTALQSENLSLTKLKLELQKTIADLKSEDKEKERTHKLEMKQLEIEKETAKSRAEVVGLNAKTQLAQRKAEIAVGRQGATMKQKMEIQEQQERAKKDKRSQRFALTSANHQQGFGFGGSFHPHHQTSRSGLVHSELANSAHWPNNYQYESAAHGSHPFGGPAGHSSLSYGAPTYHQHTYNSGLPGPPVQLEYNRGPPPAQLDYNSQYNRGPPPAQYSRGPPQTQLDYNQYDLYNNRGPPPAPAYDQYNNRGPPSAPQYAYNRQEDRTLPPSQQGHPDRPSPSSGRHFGQNLNNSPSGKSQGFEHEEGWLAKQHLNHHGTFGEENYHCQADGDDDYPDPFYADED